MRWSQHHATSYQCSTAKMKEQVFLMENISTAQVSSFAHMQSFYFQSFLWAVEEVMWLPNVTPWERRMWVTAADGTRVKWMIQGQQESAWYWGLVVFRTLRMWSGCPSVGVQWHWKCPPRHVKMSWDICMGLALGFSWGISYCWAEFLCWPRLTNCYWPQVVPPFKWPQGMKIAHCNETELCNV